MKNESKIPIISSEQFMNYFLDNNYDKNMFDSNGHINPDYNSSKKTGLIAKILEDNWDTFYKANKYLVDEYRKNAKEEFKKVIACHNKDLGSSIYQCPQWVTLFLLVTPVNHGVVLLSNIN